MKFGLSIIKFKMKIRIPFSFFIISILISIKIDAQTVTDSTANKQDANWVNVTYIANEGFFISYRGKKILIDALYPQKNPNYAAPTDELLTQMETAQPPFDNVDLILVTHIHFDHFDENSVRRCLLNNPNAVFISTPQVI